MSYHWPGNARELENAIEYAVNVETGRSIRSASLPAAVSRARPGALKPLDAKVRSYERMLLIEALETCGYSLEGKKRAARELGVSLPTLYRKRGAAAAPLHNTARPHAGPRA